MGHQGAPGVAAIATIAFASILAAAACSSIYGAEEREAEDAGAASPASAAPDADVDAAAPAGPPGCELPWGGTIAHGESVQAFETGSRSATDGPCKSETRLCFAGTLSGSFGFGTCVAEPTTTKLADSTKTIGDCLAIGGQLAEVGGGLYVCRRASNSCWNDWSRYKRWSATSPRSCAGTCATPQSCTTASHAWADKNAETCGYTQAGIKAIYCNTATCTASTVAVGCN